MLGGRLTFFMSSCCLVNPGATLHTSGGDPRNNELVVADCTCPFLLLENTFSDHVTVETTQSIVEIPTVQEEIPEIQVVGRFPRFRWWQGSKPNSQVRACGEEFHVNCNSLCFSALFPARCTDCPLTHLDDSSSSAISRLKTFAHSISQQIHTSVKNFTW